MACNIDEVTSQWSFLVLELMNFWISSWIPWKWGTCRVICASFGFHKWPTIIHELCGGRRNRIQHSRVALIALTMRPSVLFLQFPVKIINLPDFCNKWGRSSRHDHLLHYTPCFVPRVGPPCAQTKAGVLWNKNCMDHVFKDCIITPTHKGVRFKLYMQP